MADVKVYTTEGCPYCRMVIAFLEKQGIGYEAVDGGRDREAAREMIRISGQRGVPVTIFDDEVIVGFDAKRLRELFAEPVAGGVYDVVIVGAGPAGLTATVYCARKLLKTVIVSESIGGQAAWSWAIENYMGFRMITGEDLVRKFEEQARGLDVSLELDSIQEVRKEDDAFLVRAVSGNTYRCRAVILASGKYPRTLGLPGEDRLMGRGVSVCSTCDGPLFRDRPVAVVGGGNAAIQTAVEMVKIASSVTLIVRRSLTCDEVYVEQAMEMGVRILPRSEISALHGDQALTGITVRDRETGRERILDVEGLFLEIGRVPNTGFLGDRVTLNDLGEIVVDENNHTNVPGVFAAGDATCIKGKQIIIAAGEGAKAALAAHEHLLREDLSRIPIPATL